MSFSIFPIKGTIDQLDGLYCNGYCAGLKPDGQRDIGFIYTSQPVEIEALFTQNRFQAAPLKHYQHYDKHFTTNFILINAKNANALTGQEGIEDIHTIFNELGKTFSLHNPIMSSTGVIAQRLPIDTIIQTAKTFDLTSKQGESLAQAIMTTDRYSKQCLYEVELPNKSCFKIGAIAKGAGMINPSMATMLCFIATDAAVPKDQMKPLLQHANSTTFDAISVDGDTSTNDSVFFLSTGTSNTYDKEAFQEALRRVMHDMAMKMVQDGEGAKKGVAFEVTGALTSEEAQTAAKALSNSLLVKTALFGEDPNFGRIASTIGSSNVTCDETQLSIFYNDLVVYDKGTINFDPQTEQQAVHILQHDQFKIRCDLGMGKASYTAYGCDLGHNYVTLNADYRT